MQDDQAKALPGKDSSLGVYLVHVGNYHLTTAATLTLLFHFEVDSHHSGRREKIETHGSVSWLPRPFHAGERFVLHIRGRERCAAGHTSTDK